MLHGRSKSKDAENTARDTFEKGDIGKDIPSIYLRKDDLIRGINLLDFILFSKIFSSKSEIRRAIKNNGIKINNNLIVKDNLLVDESFFKSGYCKISFGKKKHMVIKLH